MNKHIYSRYINSLKLYNFSNSEINFVIDKIKKNPNISSEIKKFAIYSKLYQFPLKTIIQRIKKLKKLIKTSQGTPYHFFLLYGREGIKKYNLKIKRFKRNPKKKNWGKKLLKTNEQFILDAKKVHKYKYSYDKVDYKGSNIKIEIICPKHGNFWQTPNNHLYGKLQGGCGCPKCKYDKIIPNLLNNKIYGKSENKWLDIFNIPKKYRQYKIIMNNKRYYVDGYDPKTNTIYEYLGDYWHGNLSIYKPNDINLKNKLTFQECFNASLYRFKSLNAKYNIIYIWHSNFLKSEYLQGKIFKDKLVF